LEATDYHGKNPSHHHLTTHV